VKSDGIREEPVVAFFLILTPYLYQLAESVSRFAWAADGTKSGNRPFPVFIFA